MNNLLSRIRNTTMPEEKKERPQDKWNKYSFNYTLKENELKIDFENKKLRDSTFKVSLQDEVLTLQCLDEYFENEYELHKTED